MNQKRTVVVAGALSALLLSASAAFAVGSGLFSAGTADKVGTFQAIEQAAASRRPASIRPSSTTRPDASASTPARGSQAPAYESDSTPDVTQPSVAPTTPETGSGGFRPTTATSGGSEDHGTTTTETPPPRTIDPPTTSTSHPEHEVETPDPGPGSDD